MKHRKSAYYLFLVIALAYFSSCTGKQSFPAGYWQGLLMERFNVILELQESGGRIYSYDGDFLFQNDTLTEIQQNGDSLIFFIPDKKTWFRGLATENSITGTLQFPDGNTIEGIFAPKGKEELADKGLLPNILPSAAIITNRFGPDQIKADISEYIRVLRKNHPGVHDMLNDEEFDSMIAQLSGELTDSMDIISVLPVFMKISASLGCSHTRVRPSSPVRRAMEYYLPLLPAELMMKDGKLLMTGRIAGQNTTPDLREILSINGIPSSQVIAELSSIIPVNYKFQSSMEYEFNRYQSAYLPFLFRDSIYKLDILTDDGATETMTFQGMPVRDIDWANEGMQLDWSISTIPGQQSAIFTIPTFAYPDPMNLPVYLDSIFIALNKQGIKNLIIDLRGNEGGPPFPSRILLSYLIDKPFAYFFSGDGAQNDPTLGDLEGLYESLPQSPNVYKGKLYVLSDAGCMSTTGHFLSLIRYHKAGIIAGTSPESHFSCNDNTMDLSLPNTKTECAIPTTRFSTNVSGMRVDQPLQPDMPVDCCTGIRLSDEDPLLDMVLDKIMKK